MWDSWVLAYGNAADALQVRRSIDEASCFSAVMGEGALVIAELAPFDGSIFGSLGLVGILAGFSVSLLAWA